MSHVCSAGRGGVALLRPSNSCGPVRLVFNNQPMNITDAANNTSTPPRSRRDEMDTDGYAGRRLVAYVRCDSANVAVEVARLKGWAHDNDHRVVATVVDADRPGYPSEERIWGLLTTVQEHGAHGVLVSRFDRFGRTSLDLRFNVGRLAAAGKELHSCTEGLYQSGDGYGFSMEMLAGLAMMEHDRDHDRGLVVHPCAHCGE